MAAPSETYVDPSIAGNSGTGTVGDPYGDLQYALDTMTRDATDGDRINIKAGTDEILAAALSFATYGTPTETAPIIFQGYTTAAGDGGIGGISGNASVSIIDSSTLDWMQFVDLHLHNSGTSRLLRLDDNNIFYNCEIDNCTNATGLLLGSSNTIKLCYIYNMAGTGFSIVSGNITNSHFENVTNDFTTCVLPTGPFVNVRDCVFDLDGATVAIDCDSNSSVENNSIYSNAGTGAGIQCTSSAEIAASITGNIIEGFSGAGGIGINITGKVQLYGMNACYNNTTNYVETGPILNNLGDNETLVASPFTDASTDDFTVDTTVKGSGFPTANYPGLSVRSYVDKGALQRQEAAGGGTSGRQSLHSIESGGV